MRITENFTYRELCYSATAEQEGIYNTPGTLEIVCATALAIRVLQPLRDATGQAIRVTSWFRSASLNRVVGGDPDSQHLRAEAADIQCDRYTPAGLALVMAELALPVDQVIIYPDENFVHVSHRRVMSRNRGEWLIVRGGNYVPWDGKAS